jgi:crotonobetaine/carnitine-CoA ligase
VLTERQPLPADITTVAGALRFRAKEGADRPFMRVGSPEWLTAAELDHRTSALAVGLRALGIRPGDRVATILPNRIEAVEVFFACAKIQAIQVPMNYWLRGEFLRHQLADCEPRVLVADTEGIASAVGLLDRSQTEVIVHVDSEQPITPFSQVPYRDLIAHDPAELGPQAADPREPFSILYTAGTTGMPKGCVLSTGYYVNIGRAYGARQFVVPNDRIHTAYPIFHASGQMLTLMSTLVNGASVSYDAEFHASTFMSDAAAEHATAVFGVGFMANAILAQPETDRDAHSGLRLAFWVPLTVSQQAEFERRFGTLVISEGYGQTEVLPVSLAEVDGPRKRDSAGKILPTMDVRIVDENDLDVPDGVPGEILVRPRIPNAMFNGYWRMGPATVTSWRGLWHHTGDAAIRDKDGYLTFVDRTKDAIRRRGENVSSFQLELAISEHPAIETVAVCAVPAVLGEDDIKASIVLMDGAELSAADLFEFLRAHVPYYAIPRYVDIRASLPVNGVGRVMKQTLRDEGIVSGIIDLEALGLVVPRHERRGAIGQPTSA